MKDDADLHPEILRPYDARRNPLPPPTQDVCAAPVYNICVNEFWWSHISGQIARLLYRDAWDGTDDEIERAIDSISKILDVGRPTMGCGCGCSEIPLVRIDENGHYQQSDDGGATWHDAPQFDPRNSIPRIPPSPPTSTDNAKCAYADSVVNHFKEGFVDVLEEGQTAEELLGFLTGIAEAVFGPLTGPIGWIVPALFAIATAAVAVGLSAITAAFTPGVWNDIRCLIFNHMNADGSFTQSQLDAIYAGIPGGAVVQTLIRSWLAAIGTTGMTNAAHLAKGSTSTDCSCPDCNNLGDWAIQSYNGHDVGIEVERGDNFITLTGTSHPDFGTPYNAIIKTPDTMSCCKVQSIETLDGDGTDYHFFHVECGLGQWPSGTFTNFAGIPEPTYSNQIFIRKDSGSNFTVKITFSS